MTLFHKTCLVLSISIALAACGGGGSSSSNSSSSNNTNSSTGTTGGNTSTGTDGNISTAVTCNKGIPSGLAKINDAGMWKETLYRFDYEYPIISYQGPQLFFVNLYAYSLTNNVVYENITTINNENADPNLFLYNADTYYLNQTKLYTAHDFSKTNLGWPISYITSVNNNGFNSASFNDQCDLNVNSEQTTFEKVDLSGKLISEIIDSDKNVINYDGFKYLTNYMGLYLSGSLSASDSDNLTGSKILQASNARFPEGSYVYLPKQINVLQNFYSFDSSSRTNYKSLSEYAQNTQINSGFTWKTSKMAGYDVITAYNSDGTPNLQYDIGVNYNGVIYSAYDALVGDQMANGDYATGENALFNKTAIDALTAQIKSAFLTK